MSENKSEFAKVVEERFQAALGVTRALNLPDPSPDGALAYYLMRNSTKELRSLRARILSRRKVVYLRPDQ